MKVLHVNTKDSGGAALAAIRLHCALLQAGVDSSMLVSKFSRTDVPRVFQVPHKRLSRVVNIFRRAGRLLGLFQSYEEAVTSALAGKVIGFDSYSLSYSFYDITKLDLYKKADIIHLHWVAGFVDYSFFSKNTKPVVWTFHDMAPFTGGCHYSSGCEGYRTGCVQCPQIEGIRNPMLSKQNLAYKSRFLTKEEVVIVSLCNWMKAKIEESSLCKEMHVEKIYNSLDTDLFKMYPKEVARSLFNLPPNKRIVLIVSEDLENRRKGVDILMRAIAALGASDMLFCAVGGNRKVSDSGNTIRYLGSISDERAMAMIYNAVDVVVLPSIEDNLPNVMLEALACGTPIISFANGGMLEIVVNEVNGLLVEAFSAEALSQSLRAFFASDLQTKREEIRLRAISQFHPDVQVQKFMRLYQSCYGDAS
ncbi:MAG: glycosyltransferase [Bacteroidales bacterium]